MSRSLSDDDRPSLESLRGPRPPRASKILLLQWYPTIRIARLNLKFPTAFELHTSIMICADIPVMTHFLHICVVQPQLYTWCHYMHILSGFRITSLSRPGLGVLPAARDHHYDIQTRVTCQCTNVTLLHWISWSCLMMMMPGMRWHTGTVGRSHWPWSGPTGSDMLPRLGLRLANRRHSPGRTLTDSPAGTHAVGLVTVLLVPSARYGPSGSGRAGTRGPAASESVSGAAQTGRRFDAALLPRLLQGRHR